MFASSRTYLKNAIRLGGFKACKRRVGRVGAGHIDAGQSKLLADCPVKNPVEGPAICMRHASQVTSRAFWQPTPVIVGKFLLMVLLLFTALVASRANSISYTGGAKPIGAILKEVSDRNGLHLQATPEANREIVLVRVQDLPVQEFLDDVASATSCRWEKEGENLYLRADEGQRTKEEQDELNRRAAKIGAEIEVHLKALDAHSDKVAAGENPMEGSDGPLFQLLRSVSATDLAEIGPNDRKVWATNDATASQFSLEGDSSSVIGGWIAQHNATVTKAPAEDPNLQAITEFLPQEMKDMIKRETSPVTGAPAKALLSAKPMPYVGGLQLILTVYDRQGNPLLDANSMIASRISLATIAQAAQPGKKSAPTSSSSTKIEYSDDSKLLLKNGPQAEGGNPFGASLATSLKEKMSRPDVKDPLSFVAQDRLLAVAKLRQKQLIADIPDSDFGIGVFGSASADDTAESASDQLEKGEVIAASLSGGVLVVKSASPAEDRFNRMDRSAMAALVAKQAQKHSLSLDDVCAYAVLNPPPADNPIATLYSATLASSMTSFSLQGGLPNWDMYRLYGTLDETQRVNLQSGGSISFAAMTGDQAVCLRHIVLGASTHLHSSNGKSADFFSGIMSAFGGMSGNGRLEPTEVMPNGLPQAGFFTCSSSDEAVVQLDGMNAGASSFVAGPSELAMFKMISGMNIPGGSSFSMPTSGVLGQRTNLTFLFHVSGDLVQDEHLADVTIPEDGDKVSLSQLPDDFQTEVNAQAEALKKSPLGMLQALPMFRNTPRP
jgi:hypothetical protein